MNLNSRAIELYALCWQSTRVGVGGSTLQRIRVSLLGLGWTKLRDQINQVVASGI